jgi:hypothetical protein
MALALLPFLPSLAAGEGEEDSVEIQARRDCIVEFNAIALAFLKIGIPSRYVFGGAGTFDGIFLTGILAVLLSAFLS